ncbi:MULTISPECIES: Rpn family recombination-promoting nuclease/putative transposase [unclassified Moorena]|uniref:Rpn family recombination-promoting nuclease/putative transposase n=1 Tax=unclassified Moorena TaxID=2683338 RepID=UPI0013FEC830|nr:MULTISPECIES: Rpn family recombination-promoting nuclease/putative transposase [unclassified Moorena]NEO14054.1 Rpn family recombination-promoting nuclease/putative transposase [Moorena sp. SIO3E8]NEQ00529.1 Rpn family recombination-promoting nuclease/putative transposase [Moorena sp. SIO3F7]
MRFISPKTDFAFKKIFGSSESKEVLISFLNALIYQGESRINNLDIIDPYNAGYTTELKDTYLDVKAILNDGSTVIIEMQVLNVPAFDKRVIYNLAKTYANQLKSGQGYYKLKPVIALTITDFTMFEETDRYLTRFVFKEDQDNFIYRNQHLSMVFVELPKFSRGLEDLETASEKWIYFMKEAPNLEAIPDTLSEIPEIAQALTIANQANMSRKDLEELHKREVFMEDRKGEIRQALEEGREEGKLEGREEGRLLMQGLISRQLEGKLGAIPSEIIEGIQQLSLEQLEGLGVAMADFSTSVDLSNWLHDNQ